MINISVEKEENKKEKKVGLNIEKGSDNLKIWK